MQESVEPTRICCTKTSLSKAALLQIWCETSNNVVVASFRPSHGRVVHLVDGNDELADTNSLSKDDVLSSLPAIIKTGFELVFAGRYNLKENDVTNRAVLRSRADQHTNISLLSATNHMRDKPSMSRAVENGKPACSGGEMSDTIIPSLALIRS